ncbi:tyrosine-type recombinase/integrase [Sorangium sp. So ce861]|uniref:tyrosine-type recombinase/integrase n=1 Tax=Sorangium sp. So ce861 TaxID=3133323 RepID=UPI003F634985
MSSSAERRQGTAPSAAGDKRANGSGSVRLRRNTWTARLSLGEAGRRTFSLPTCRTEQEANARLEVLADLSRRLLVAGQIVLGLPLLEQVAAREGSALRDVRLAIEQLCKGEARPRASGETTFAAFAERVLSGKLAEQYPYPDEDQRLMRSQLVPLCFRIYYGFLTREGMRADEAGTLEWSDVDLDRGAVVLDENKTDDPRAWALSPDVVRALRAYRELWPDNRRVFVGPKGDPLPGCHG